MKKEKLVAFEFNSLATRIAQKRCAQNAHAAALQSVNAA